MAYETLPDLSAGVTISLGGVDKKTGKKNPTEVEGYYLGSRQTETKKGPATLHFFQGSKGNVGVWGKTDMNKQLANARVGAMTKVSYTGMVATSKGEMYKYQAQQDRSRTIEVGDLSSGNGNEGLADNDYADTEGDHNEESYGNDDADDTAYGVANNAKLAAEKKAKVEALLSNKRKTN